MSLVEGCKSFCVIGSFLRLEATANQRGHVKFLGYILFTFVVVNELLCIVIAARERRSVDKRLMKRMV